MQKPFAVRVAVMMGLALVLAGGEAFSQDLSFFTLPPCRVADTRNPAGPFGGPALSSGAARIFLVAGVCGVPPEATAVAANFTIVQPTAQGHVTAYPGNLAPPLVSSVNFGGGQTRANNALVPLATNGAGTLAVYPFVLGSGQAHLILDVFGYFAPEPQTTLESSSPLDEEREVAVTRETILRFSAPLAPASVTAAAIAAESAGFPRSGRLYLSKDGRSVTIFYDEPLPAGARARITVDGEILRDTRGRKVDADRDGRQGGVGTVDFETLSLAVAPGTVVCGRVLASELGTDGSGQTVDVPLEGATITVDGAEATLRATTDANGNFCLDPAPGSLFFVHIDGRTATNGVPVGAYYPYVGKAWNPVRGRTTNVGTAHLPLVRPGTLQPVAAATDTVIHFAPSVVQDFPEFADVAITVPAGALFADDGTPGGQVGIAPVPPDRLPGQLPPGLEFPVVITVQTDGATNFDSPAPVCFPNLPDPATGEIPPAGSKDGLMSFNHDSGRWEHVGSMTVSGDRRLVCSDPGYGILAPGWHAAGPPPASPPPKPADCPSPEPCLPEPVPPPDPVPPPPPLPPLPCDGNPAYDDCLERNCTPDYQDRQQECRDIMKESLGACSEIFGLFKGMVLLNQTLKAFNRAFTACKVAVYAGIGYCHLDNILDSSDCMASCAQAYCPSPAQAFQRAVASDPVIDLITSTGRQTISLLRPYIQSGARLSAVPQVVLQDIEALWIQADNAAGGNAADYFLSSLAEKERSVFRLFGEPLGNAPAWPVLYMAQIRRPSGELVLRGKTLPFGQYSLAVPRDGDLLQVIMYDPVSHAYAVIRPYARPEAVFRLPRFHLEPITPDLPDFDSDGLPDLLEAVYGTGVFQPDTDGDGVDDGQEVSLGSDPLGRDLHIGDVVNGAIAFPGEVDRYSFTAMAGQAVFFDLQAGDTGNADWELADSSGTVIFDRGFFLDVGPFTLTRGGTYTLTVRGTGLNYTGTYRFQLWNVPPPDTFAIAIGDTVSSGVPGPGAGNIETPGVRDIYTFSAAAGQSVFFDYQAGGSAAIDWKLVDAAGTVVFDRGFFLDVGPYTLALGGTYTLTLGEAGSDHAGTYRFQLWNVPPPDTSAIAIGDTVSGNIETPGVRDIYTFSAAAGQSVFFDYQAGGTAGLDWKLVDAAGTVVFDRGFFQDAGPYTLALGGTYTLTLGEAGSDHTGTYAFQVTASP